MPRFFLLSPWCAVGTPLTSMWVWHLFSARVTPRSYLSSRSLSRRYSRHKLITDIRCTHTLGQAAAPQVLRFLFYRERGEKTRIHSRRLYHCCLHYSLLLPNRITRPSLDAGENSILSQLGIGTQAPSLRTIFSLFAPFAPFFPHLTSSRCRKRLVAEGGSGGAWVAAHCFLVLSSYIYRFTFFCISIAPATAPPPPYFPLVYCFPRYIPLTCS